MAKAENQPIRPSFARSSYLAVVIDAYPVVVWSVAEHPQAELVIKRSRWRCGTGNLPGLVHHSDHGSHVPSVRPAARGRHLRVDGQPGDALDNAVAESFFATLQNY